MPLFIKSFFKPLKIATTASIILLLEACVYDNLSEIKIDPPIPKNACAAFVDGYTDKISYAPGEKMKIFIHAKNDEELCRLEVYDLGGKSVFAFGSSIKYQPIYSTDPSSDGFNYSINAMVTVPDIKSGIYLIENKIPFIIKTTKAVDLLVVYPSNTANAYCESGGKSLYSKLGRPVEVSFQRPIPLQNLSEHCLKWFSRLANISIGFIADSDLESYSNIASSKIICIVGHSEYWTRQGRINFDRFVNAGGHALILSGNTMWWQVRYSDDRSKLICYRNDSDPVPDPLLKTLTWDTPSLEFPIINSIGADFSHGGYGMQLLNQWSGFKITSPTSPLLEGLNLKKGDVIKLPTLEYDGAPLKGYEYDGTPLINTDTLGFNKIEMIGFNKAIRVKETAGTFIIFRRTPSSGIIVNTASTDWCSHNGMGGESGDVIKKITLNAITKLLKDQPLFTN